MLGKLAVLFLRLPMMLMSLALSGLHLSLTGQLTSETLFHSSCSLAFFSASLFFKHKNELKQKQVGVNNAPKITKHKKITGHHHALFLKQYCNLQVWLLFPRLKTIATLVNYTFKRFIQFPDGNFSSGKFIA